MGPVGRAQLTIACVQHHRGQQAVVAGLGIAYNAKGIAPA